jgi:hypothetical protein
MPVPGREDGDGVEATSPDERIIKLRADVREGGGDATSPDEQITKPEVGAREDGDGVDAMSLDEQIIKLRACARVGVVNSFRLKAHAVAVPSGIPHTEIDNED